MIWYVIGGLIGIIFFKKRYHLSTWSAIGYGVSLTLCVYFGVGAITGFVASSTGIDDIGTPWLYGFLFVVFLVVFIISIKRMRNHSITKFSDTTESIETRKISEISIQEGRRYKRCPFCAEYILEEAVYCRWCNQNLNNSETTKSFSISTPVYQSPSNIEKKRSAPAQSKKLDKTWLILSIFFVLPFIALVIWGASNNNEKDTLSKPTTQNTNPTFTPTTQLVSINSCYIRRKNDNSQMIIIGPDVDDVCNGLVKENPDLLYLVDGPIDAEKVCEITAYDYKIVVRDTSLTNLESTDLCGYINAHKSGGYLNLFSKLLSYFTNLGVSSSSESACTKWSDVTKNDIGKEICVYGIVVNAYYSENYKGYFILFSSDPSALYIVKYGDKLFDDLTGKCVQYTGILGKVWDTPVMSMGIDDPLHQCGTFASSNVNNQTPPTQRTPYSTATPVYVSQPTVSPTVSNPVLDITIKVTNHCSERHVVIFEGPVHLKYDVGPGETKEWQGAKGVYSWTVDGIPGQQSPMELWVSVWTLTLCYTP